METQRKEGKEQTWNETEGALVEINPQPVYMPGLKIQKLLTDNTYCNTALSRISVFSSLEIGQLAFASSASS